MNSKGNPLDLFHACVTGDCVTAQMILLAAGPEYGVAKIIDEKIDKTIHGDAYDRGEVVAQVLTFLLPIAQEIKATIF